MAGPPTYGGKRWVAGPRREQVALLAGVSVEYPFLDDEVVEFSCRVPPGLKMKGPRLRWFFKHALRELLPREILRKKKHGMGVPFGVWMPSHPQLHELAMDGLAGMRKRGIVRPEFIDNAIELQRTDHAVYYGVLIWMLLLLEHWFRAQEERR